MKRLWMAFMYPHGTRRQLNPRAWYTRDRILVAGELLAVSAAVAAIAVELTDWPHAAWLIIAATIVGTCALLWYALDLITVGEMPLTNRSAHTIRQVIEAVEMEKRGVRFDWERIDRRGGIPIVDDSNWTRLDPELRAIMEEHGVPLAVAVAIRDAQRQPEP